MTNVIKWVRIAGSAGAVFLFAASGFANAHLSFSDCFAVSTKDRNWNTSGSHLSFSDCFTVSAKDRNWDTSGSYLSFSDCFTVSAKDRNWDASSAHLSFSECFSVSAKDRGWDSSGAHLAFSDGFMADTISPTGFVLYVKSIYNAGTPSPAIGKHVFTAGSIVTANVSTAVQNVGDREVICVGWAGTGSVPSSDSGTEVTLEITNDVSSLTWLWDVTAWRVAFDMGSHGARSGGGALTQMVPVDGSAVAPTVNAQLGWRFTGWDAAFTTVTNPLAVHAVYEVWRPDLAVTDISVPTEVLTGFSFPVNWTLANTGDADFGGAMTERIWLVPDGGGEARSLASVPFSGSLSVGMTTERHAVIPVFSDVLPGLYRLKIETATNCSVPETEGNNETFSSPFAVVATPDHSAPYLVRVEPALSRTAVSDITLIFSEPISNLSAQNVWLLDVAGQRVDALATAGAAADGEAYTAQFPVQSNEGVYTVFVSPSGVTDGGGNGMGVLQQVYVNDFESGADACWSDTKASPILDGYYLGNFGTQEVTLTVSNAVSLAGGLLAFDFLRLDSWDRETFYVKVNGVLFDEVTLGQNAVTMEFGETVYTKDDTLPNDWNNNYTANWDSMFRDVQVPLVFDTNGICRVTFGGIFDEGLSNESWGIDNVRVSVVVTNDAPQSATFTIDTALPTVTEMTLAGQTLSGTISSFMLTFSELMRSATVNGQTIKLIRPDGAIVMSSVVQIDRLTYRISFSGQTAPGTYMVTVNGAQDVAGNICTYDGTFQIAQPDLTVTGLVVPSEAIAGSVVPLSWTLANAGESVFNGTMTERVWLIPEGGGDARLLTSLPFSGTLDAGANSARMASVMLPVIGAEGVWRIRVETATGSSIFEINGNNEAVSSGTLTIVEAALPDLTVFDVLAPQNLIPGKSAVFSYTVSNAGLMAASAPWTERLYLSQNGSVSGGVLLHTLRVTNGLDSAASVTRAVETVIPSTIPLGGAVKAVAVVDALDEVVERPGGMPNEIAAGETSDLATVLTLETQTASVTENAVASLRCIVRRSGSLSSALNVVLSSSRPGDLSVPAFVAIPIGQNAAVFYAVLHDNSALDGMRTAVLNASVTGYQSASASIIIADDEVPSLTLSLSPQTAFEGESVAGTVTRNGSLDASATVYLTGISASQAQMPGSVTIPVGAAEAGFVINVKNDDVAEVDALLTLRANATGYTAATTTLSILDDDVPSVILTLAPEEVSEGAGPQAVMARLEREDTTKVSQAITVHLRASLANTLILPASVTIPKNTLAVTFAVGTMDNAFVDGGRDVTVTGSIFIDSCGCGGAPSGGGAIEAMLHVTDNDGPALTVTANPATMKEGVENAGVLTITRNTPTDEPLTVTLSTDRYDELNLPETVVIPIGESSVTVSVETLDDGITDGSQVVSVYADAEGFTAGSTWVMVSDQNLPDFMVTEVIGPIGSVGAGESFELTFALANSGFAASAGAVQYEVHLLAGTTSITTGTNTLLYAGETESALATGTVQTVTLVLDAPSVPGTFRVAVLADSGLRIIELNEANNAGYSVPFAVSPIYTAVAATDTETALASDVILVYGTAIMNDGVTLATNAAVEVYIIVDGIRRMFSAVTDATGAFEVLFTPLTGEAGHYTLGACYPGAGATDAQDSFDILGLERTTKDYIVWDIVVGDETEKTISLRNRSGTPLTGVQAEVLDAAQQDIQVEFSLPETLDGFAVTELSCVLNAFSPSEGNDYVKPTLRVTSAEGVVLDIPIYFYAQAQQALLKTEPTTLDATMLRGEPRLVEFTIWNAGAGDSGPITVSAPNVPWLKLVGGGTIASLTNNAAATVTLELLADESIPFNAPLTGSLAINCVNGNGVALPFRFETVSEATGGIRVDVVDDYTYYLASAPHVSNAMVTVQNPYTGAVVVKGITDETGVWQIDGLPIGMYTIDVSAECHSSWRNAVEVKPGRPNRATVFLDYQAVSYSWVVVPTGVKDEYDIQLVVDYQVQIPAPVLIMSLPPKLPLLSPDEEFVFNVIIENKGLIAAYDFELYFPDAKVYDFTPLVGQGVTINAMSSVTFPVKMTVRGAAPSPQMAGQMKVALSSSSNDTSSLPYAYTVHGSGTTYCNGEARSTSTAGQTWFEGGMSDISLHDMLITWYTNRFGDGPPMAPSYDKWNSTISAAPKPKLYWTAPCPSLPCEREVEKAIENCFMGFVPIAGTLNAANELSKGGHAAWRMAIDGIFLVASGISDGGTLATGGTGWLAGLPLYIVECVWESVKAIIDCVSRYMANTAMLSMMDVATASTELDFWRLTNLSPPAVPPLPPNDSVPVSYDNPIALDAPFYAAMVYMQHYYYALFCWSLELFGDVVWLDCTTEELTLFLGRLKDVVQFGDSISVGDLVAVCPANITLGQLETFAERWNSSITSWNATGEDSEEENSISLEKIRGYAAIIVTMNEYASGWGYGTVIGVRPLGSEVIPAMTYASEDTWCPDALDDMVTKEMARVKDYLDKQQSSVCAKVSLSLSQTVSMTREAFEGTLTLFNGNTEVVMTDVRLDLRITDESGEIKNDLFEITTQRLDALTEIDGTGELAPNATGTAVIRFLPTHDAAPMESRFYKFGGTLSYIDPFSGEQVTVTLYPIQLEVRPSPRLDLHYFLQRDVLGDDPFTADIVEPSLPAEFSLLLVNKGYGVARNVAIDTAQPKIVDNEKGLAIEFALSGSALNGQEKTLGLITTSVGDIAARSSAAAQWWLTASLQGHFTELNAKVRALNHSGSPAVSLIDQVVTHELIRSIVADGDGLPDFLTTELNMHDEPDTLWHSDGTVEDVSRAVAVTQGQGATVSGANPSVGVTVTAADAGWFYTRLPDPGNGLYAVVRVTRQDGSEVPLRNVWLTDRTFPDVGDVVYENRLHLADFMAAAGTETYTVEFAALDEDPPAVERFEGVTDGSIIGAAVESIDVVFSEEIDPATFTAADVELRCQGAVMALAGVSVQKIEEVSYRITGLGALTTADGMYQLTVQAAGITDVFGNPGVAGKRVTWTKAAQTPAVSSVTGVTAGAAVQALDTLDVRFTQPLATGSFSSGKVLVNGEAIDGLNVMTLDDSGTFFRVSGIATALAEDGTYTLTIDTTALINRDGTAGNSVWQIGWIVDRTGPMVSSLTRGQVRFNEAVAELPLAALALMRDGVMVGLPSSVAVARESGDTFAIQGLQGMTDGSYTLTVDAARVADAIGNVGSGTMSVSWTIDTVAPDAIADLAIAPDTGESATDGVTSVRAFTVTGTLPEDGLTVQVSAVYPGGGQTALTKALPVDGTSLSVPVSLLSGGNVTLVVRCVDPAGNASETSLVLFVDEIDLTVTIGGVPQSIHALPEYLTLTFTEEIVEAELAAALAFMRDGVPCPLDGMTVVKTDVSEYRVEGLADVIALRAGHYRFSVDTRMLHKLRSGRCGAQVVSMTWEYAPHKYDVHLFADDSDMPFTTVQVPEGGTYGALPEPVYDDWAFGGWWTSTRIWGGSQIFETTPFDIAVTNLYALWVTPEEDFIWKENEAGGMTLVMYLGDSEDVVIPRKVDDLPVTEIGAAAFAGHSTMQSVLFPPDVSAIGTNSFMGCSALAGITLPDGVLAIEDGAFRMCAALANLQLNKRLERIGDEAFAGCTSLARIILPDSVAELGAYVFNGCTALGMMELGAGITTIPDGLLQGCAGLAAFQIGSNITAVGASTFNGCTMLTRITIPDSVESLGDAVFKDCVALEYVVLGTNLTAIGAEAFMGCLSLEAITLSENVLTLGADSFKGCSNLLAVIAGDVLAEIGSGAFSMCPDLLAVYFKGDAPVTGAGLYDGAGMVTTFARVGTEGWSEPWNERPLAWWTEPGTITETTPVPVPYIWLERYPSILFANGMDYEAAGYATGANGYPVWQSWFLNCDPTDTLSVLMATIQIDTDGIPIIGWRPPNPGRESAYQIIGKKSLSDPEWLPADASHQFFKIRVLLP